MQRLSTSASPAPPAADWSDALLMRQAVLRFLRVRCRDEHLAEDLAHETLLRAARFRSRERAPRYPVSWAVQIAANVHRDHARREGRYQLVPDDDPLLQGLAARPEHDPEEGMIRVDGRDRPLDEVLGVLRRALPELSERDRAVLDGYYADDGSTERAVELSGAPSRTIKVRLFRARQRLEQRVRRALTAAGNARLVLAPGDLPPTALEA